MDMYLNRTTNKAYLIGISMYDFHFPENAILINIATLQPFSSSKTYKKRMRNDTSKQNNF